MTTSTQPTDGAQISNNANSPRRVYLRTPSPQTFGHLRLALHLTASILLVPWYWARAALSDGPGLRFRARCFTIGARLLSRARNRDAAIRSLRLMLMPMDSTRYFEFDYAARMTESSAGSRCLDVSSPRLVPICLALTRPELTFTLINPDTRDLQETRALLADCQLLARCKTHAIRVSELDPRERFDLITCVSVLEHIPDDTEALRVMHSLLHDGGRLVLTVPCMSEAFEQFIDVDEYGLLPKDSAGFVFWQRYYDAASLQDRIFSVLGPPSSLEVYGENRPGLFAENAEQKRKLRLGYPFWREPYMMATEYREFTGIDELPGEGVACMTFVRK